MQKRCPFARSPPPYPHFERSEKSLSFAVRGSRFPRMCRAPLRFSHLSFMPPVPYPPPSGHLPLEGKADDTGIPSSKMRRSRHLNPFNPLNPEPFQPRTLSTIALRYRFFVKHLVLWRIFDTIKPVQTWILVLRTSIKSTFHRHTNAVRISVVATCFPLRGKCRRQ